MKLGTDITMRVGIAGKVSPFHGQRSKVKFVTSRMHRFRRCGVQLTCFVPATIQPIHETLTLLSKLQTRYIVTLYIHLYSPKMVASIEKKNIHTNKNIQ